MADKVLMKGNEAIAEAAIRAGCRNFFGYPITCLLYTSEIRSLLDSNGIIWQTGELGKVDAGGGGTVAKYIAALNADVVDLGVPVLSMHSPFEVVSKLDLYMAKQAFSAFMNQQAMGAV